MGYKLTGAYIYTARLPAEYQEVEYIQSSWTQYINTWAYINPDYTIEMKFEITSNERYNTFFGTRTNWKQRFIWRTENVRNGVFFIQRSTGVNDTTTYGYEYWEWAFSTNTIYTIKMNKELYLNWTLKKTFSNSTSSTLYDNPVYLFALDSDWGTYDYFYWKSYYCKLWDDSNNLIKDLVPCYRIADWEIWMYDLVTDTFFTNQGTWTFAKGNDVWGLQEKQLRPSEWQPWANTIAYFPLKTDQLDVTGNYTLSATGTQQTVGYQFNTACGFSYETAVAEKYFSYWVNVSSSTRCALGINNYWAFRLNWRNNATTYERFVFKNSGGSFYESSDLNLSYGTRYHIAYSIDWSGNYNGFINGSSVYSGTQSFALFTVSNIINNTTWNIILSDIIIESEPRTATQVSDYFNNTKSNYWIS